MDRGYFSDLSPVLANRSSQAAISQLGFANVPLRRYLQKIFGRPYGSPGAFLADPAFEAVFGWKSGSQTMGDLAGELLTADLIDAMDRIGEHRFARELQPYSHQIEAWNILARREPQSLIVSSGTGSGKTECFMVPILDRLVRLRQQQESQLIGVRALFLYPLNALINSQRQRLRAWTEPFGEAIRFCLYNGATPERPAPARNRRDHPSEIMDRQTLRNTPPPILVTNSTMLEYMLVRTVDAPILEHSQGRLEWVVLDEAHSYIGSQAAEISLLIRRVLNAFGVKPENVRFVATSATIGDPKGEAGQNLRRFLAELAGVDRANVHLVAGERQIPMLAKAGRDENNLELDDLAAIESDAEIAPKRYALFTKNRTARRIRDLFTDSGKPGLVARLSEVCAGLYGKQKRFSKKQQQQVLHWLDLLSSTRDRLQDGAAGESFLPLRGHFYHQTLSGIWACADRNCTKRKDTELDDDRWSFGMLHLEPRKHCECGCPVYEVVNCGECGSVYLLGQVREGRVEHLEPWNALDEFELEFDMDDMGDDSAAGSEDEDQEQASYQHRVLIANRSSERLGPIDLDMASRRITEPSEATVRLLAQEDAGDGLVCPDCKAQEQRRKRLFMHARLGAPFLLGTILPTLLEYAPDGSDAENNPCRGRRLLTFNDSRQGTARMAAKLQQDAERSRVRGLIYHLALQYGQSGGVSDAKELAGEIETLESLCQDGPDERLKQLIEEKKSKLTQLALPKPIPFKELALDLGRQGRDFTEMLAHYRRFAPEIFGRDSGEVELANMFLVREFGRRPRRMNNLETMGMVAVHYPALDQVDRVPDIVIQAAEFDLNAWKAFLKICLDFFVRGGGSLAFPGAWGNWLGMPFRQSWLVAADQATVGRPQRRWPKAVRSGMHSILVRLLSHVLPVDIETALGAGRVDSVLQAAWDALCRIELLRQDATGRVLPLDQLAFAPMEKAWACPVTRRFLDVTLQGVTPYLPRNPADETARCHRYALPVYETPFGGVTEDQERIRMARQWLREQKSLAELREQGLWSNLNDKVIELAPYFRAAEHSAQQDSKTLEYYERAFQQGKVNLLSCSTTMEMGIDIGGVSMVAMNNVPPHPANYLQRAGRAGRRREGRSLAMTLCKSNPHDQAVFRNTRWPFDTILPAPKVSLDSRVIVQRHIHSYLLARFLENALDGSGQEQLKLTCGLFFLGEEAQSDRFIAWCRNSRSGGKRLEETVVRLLKHTVLENVERGRLKKEAAEAMGRIAGNWRKEWDNLEKEKEEIRRADGGNAPVFRAMDFRMKRMEEEYLLRELATQGFLPAYGFPINIAAFDNYTVGQFKRDKTTHETRRTREDNPYRRRELASRDLATALREYSPGSEIVMDGLVYRSAGLTLNWHIPADQTELREVQNIRYAWRCSQCGTSGSNRSLERAGVCEGCGSSVKPEDIREFIEPAGFSVDFYQDSGNDITTQHFVPVDAPWIDVDGEWLPLPGPDLGRFRTSTRGWVFHQSRGTHRTGYALCLECGRAEPMTADGDRPKALAEPHRKLRQSRQEGRFCPGSENPWKIKEKITLGHESWTDILEMQLQTENGVWLNDPLGARTLAVALRDAVAELMGVQSTELGCDIKPAKVEKGSLCQSIFVFDRHAAGYASNVGHCLEQLFRSARKRLSCPANCDSVCPHCVLDFDQRFAAESMDRHAALAVLNEAWLNQLKLPQRYAFFGEYSRLEQKPLGEAIWQVASTFAIDGIRLFAGGSVDDWDIATSSLRRLAYRLSSDELNVVIALPEGMLKQLAVEDRYLLASMADTPHIDIYTIDSLPRCGDGWLLAESFGSEPVSWAAHSEDSLVFGQEWGAGSVIVRGAMRITESLNSRKQLPDSLRPPSEPGDQELEVHHQLDGPIKGFGKRFWIHIRQHPGVESLLSSSDMRIVNIAYRDRYLFTPLSVRLLAEIVSQLKRIVGQERWEDANVIVATLACRPGNQRRSWNKPWSDWKETTVRDRVLRTLLSKAGISTSVQINDIRQIGHGRVLEVTFSAGKKIVIRFDQGVSYWRVAISADLQDIYFNFAKAPQEQGDCLEKLSLQVTGDRLPTQLFLKIG